MSSITEKKIRRVALRSTDKPKPPAREKPVPIIIEVAADGWITVYGPQHVRPIIFNRLHIADSAMADDVDEFHALDIPRGYRKFYFPRHVRATGLVEKRTIEAEYLRREKIKDLREWRFYGAIVTLFQLAADIKKGNKK